MKWLNIELSKLRAPEYIGSDPTHRATWWNLLGYCVEQENGGRIVGCLGFKSRMWEQSCGVTKDEVLSDSMLWKWEGQDLIIWEYPLAKESEVIAKREFGRLGGLSKTQAKTEASRVNGALGGRPKIQTATQPQTEDNPSITQAETKGETQGKIREEKIMEGKGIEREVPLPSIPEAYYPTLDEVKTKCQFIGLAEWRGVAWWNEMRGCDKWISDGRPGGPSTGPNGASQKPLVAEPKPENPVAKRIGLEKKIDLLKSEVKRLKDEAPQFHMPGYKENQPKIAGLKVKIQETTNELLAL
jgi:hypothetical protein